MNDAQVEGVKKLAEIYFKIPPINLYSIQEVYALVLMRISQ